MSHKIKYETTDKMGDMFRNVRGFTRPIRDISMRRDATRRDFFSCQDNPRFALLIIVVIVSLAISQAGNMAPYSATVTRLSRGR